MSPKHANLDEGNKHMAVSRMQIYIFIYKEICLMNKLDNEINYKSLLVTPKTSTVYRYISISVPNAVSLF